MTANVRSYSIAVIPGDGIGKEVVPEGLRVLEAAARLYGFTLRQDFHDFSSCDYYLEHGRMMPDDWQERLIGSDAIFFGAVGWPATVPDHVSLWGSLLQIRRQFDQYVNLRPARLFAGVPCPLAGRAPGDIDLLIVRENTEGEYSSVGGRMFEGTEREIVLQETVMTRRGVDRILRFAFETARTRPRRHLTSATKSNGLAISMPYWDERFAEMAMNYPDVSVDKQHIDILAANFVLKPDSFDVVVGSNLFGDILTDEAAMLSGSMGLLPSASLGDGRNRFGKPRGLYEPIHGSAPDIAGQNNANPLATILSLAMMLRHSFGAELEAARIERAVRRVLADGWRTPDIAEPGAKTVGTVEMGRHVVAALAE